MARIAVPVLTSLALGAALALPLGAHADAPGPTVVNGHKVLTLVSRDPPGVRCNNNIQVAAEIANIYKIPVQVIPVSLAGPGAKAPAVYYGTELIAVDGGAFNGMVSYAMVEGVLEVEDVPKQATKGRLMDVKADHDRLKNAIKSP
ncbi:MAG: hypothetical protein M5U08_21910 [Burkholderiales bacterium]|nr:hypothetical protein [Burkholderiales bacterium]